MMRQQQFLVRIARRDELVICSAWLGPLDWTVRDYVGFLIIEVARHRCVGAALLRFAAQPPGDHFILSFKLTAGELLRQAFPALLTSVQAHIQKELRFPLLVVGVPHSAHYEELLTRSGFLRAATTIFYRGTVATGLRVVARSAERVQALRNGLRVAPLSACPAPAVAALVAAETQGVGVGARALIAGDKPVLEQFSSSFGALFEDKVVGVCIARRTEPCAFIEALAVNAVGRRLHATPALIQRVLDALERAQLENYEFVTTSVNRPMMTLARHLACEEVSRSSAWLLATGRQG